MPASTSVLIDLLSAERLLPLRAASTATRCGQHPRQPPSPLADLGGGAEEPRGWAARPSLVAELNSEQSKWRSV
jgi:hypothetical protein